MCTKCKDDRCGGMYLLHSRELSDRYRIMKKELAESANRKFILINSPSSGEIFTRFYREPEVHEKPGVGIGLYLARTIIELQKGYIEVQSEVGKGACFRLYLPVKES